MRRFSCVMMIVMVSLVGIAGSAGASPTIDLVWSGSTGTNPGSTPGGTNIASEAGDVITLDIFMTGGTEGLGSVGFSVSFDTSELQVAASPGEFGVPPAAFPCSPFPTCFTGPRPDLQPLSAGVNGVDNTAGFVFTFENATLTTNNAFDTFGPWLIGSIVFSVQSGVSTNGVDVQTGFFNPGIDAAYDANGIFTLPIFGSAAVDAFGPEPGTATLLGLGLVGLAVAGRRIR